MLEISERHTWWGEAFGVACWLWIFHRARQDLPVVLGFRHAFEHAPGDDHGDHGHGGHDGDDHVKSKLSLKKDWDKFSTKAMQQVDEDDEEDEEEEEDDDDE
jgi:hypothetical protein